MQQAITVCHHVCPMLLPKRCWVGQPELQQLLDCLACAALLHSIRRLLCCLEGLLRQASAKAVVDLQPATQAQQDTTSAHPANVLNVKLQQHLRPGSGKLNACSHHACRPAHVDNCLQRAGLRSLTCAHVVSSAPGPATRSSGPLSLYFTMMYACMTSAAYFVGRLLL